jgi:predicted short-subunit dehydrogenase-like oxidoreductase (DUF2520 family)
MAVVIPSPPYRIALIGAGRVGTAVAELMRRRGHLIVGVASATAGSAVRASERLEAPAFDATTDLPPCELVLIATPDAAIAGVARAVSSRMEPGTVVVHFAGSLGIDVLSSVTDVGGLPCALHPVQACPDVDTAVARLPGSAWGVTCSHGLEEWASALIERDLEGVPVLVHESERPLWHAAAVTTSNGIAALLATGEAMLAAMGVECPHRVLGPLAAGTVANARDGGGGAATLTGPVARGEVETVARHLDRLGAEAPHLSEAYVLAARLIVIAARRARSLDDATIERLAELLEGS